MRAQPVIDELAAHQAQTLTPAAWIDLAHGRVSAQEAAAAVADLEPDDLVQRSLLMFAPPSAEDDAARLDALLQEYFPETAAGSGRSRWPLAVVALLAACVLLVLAPRLLSMVRAPEAFDGGYALTLSRGHQGMRAATDAPAEVPVYVEGRRIELRLRPLNAVSQPVGVRVFAVGDAQTLALGVQPRINASGVVEIIQTTEALGLPVGRWRLVAVVGPEATLPSTFADVREDDAAAPYDVVGEWVQVVAPDDLPSP